MEKSKKILVSNLPQNVHCDFIELFFENTKKYGGGTVKDVEYDENSATAIVEFETSQAVDTVLQNKNVRMMGQDVRVEAYREKPQSIIEVRGPTSLINRHNLEILQLYFESPRNNGGKVEDVTFDSLRSLAFVTFESDKVAKRVTEHTTHVLKGQKLEVKLRQKPSCQLKHAHISDEIACTVRVSGLKEIPSKDIVEFYFENKRRSGGGTITAFVLHGTDDDVADITFKDVKDAKAVAERNHVINGISIEVSMLAEIQERPVYQDRFLVEGLQDNTTEDCLVFFFEAKTGLKTKSIAYHRDRTDCVLITMESALDVEQLGMDCKTETVDGATLRVSEVSVSNCIYVSNLPADITKDTIELYFENTKRSKGGPVDKVTVIDDTSCLVYFKDHTVVSDILNQLQSLSNNMLNVCLYIECLKLTEEDAFSNGIPQPVTVTHLDIRKIKFINQADEFRHEVEKILNAQHANVEWSEGSEDHGVKINCTARATVIRSNKLTRRWQKEIKETFEKLMNRIYIHTIRLEAEQLCAASSVECIADEHVLVLTDKGTSTVTIVGASTKLDTAIRSVYGSSADADEEFKEEKVSLAHEIEFEMLKYMNFENRIRELLPNSVIKMTRDGITVAFEGTPIDIKSAKLLMFEIKNEFITAFTDTLSQIVIEVYNMQQTTEFVNAKLKAKSLQCFWSITDQRLIICCQKQYDLDRCISVIKSSVVENVIDLNENEVDFNDFDVLKEKLQEWQQMYPEKVTTSLEENCRLHLCSTDDISQRLLSDVKATTQKLIELKQTKLKNEAASSSEEYVIGDTVMSVTMNCDTARERFLKMYRQDLIQEVEDMSGRYKVKLSFQGEKVIITGSKNGTAETMKKFTEVFETLKCEKHCLYKVATRDVLLGRKTQGPIANIERETRCIIVIPEENVICMQSTGVEDSIVDSEVGFLKPLFGKAQTKRKRLFGMKFVDNEEKNKRTSEDISSMELQIYSDSKVNIDRCRKELDAKLDKTYTTKKVENYKEIVKSLTNEEMKELDIDGLANITIDTQAGVITIEGPTKQVSDVTHEFQMKLLKLERERHDAAEELFKLVQWQYEECTMTEFNLIPYDKRLNQKIEQAYKANKSVFEFEDYDCVFVIDFKQLIEYRKSDEQDKLRVLRKDILKSAASALPEEWAAMKDNENIKVQSIPNTDQTYQDISNRFLTEIKTGSYAHRLNFNPNNLQVNKIERIQNKTLYQQYQAKRRQMTEQKPNLPSNMPIERELWYGPKYAAVTSIQVHGFNRSYTGNANGDPWYGEWVCFAANASYSARGWRSRAGARNKRYMFLVKTLSGQMCQGKRGMKYLPPVDTKDPTILYDCAVDNLQNPMEFVIFNDTQAYPAYIITFTT